MIAFYKVEVPAGDGKAASMDVTGSVFICQDITIEESGEQSIDMQIGGGPKFPCLPGLTIRQTEFTRLIFYNRTSVKRTVEFWVGEAGVAYDFTPWQRPVRTIIKPTVEVLVSGVELYNGIYLSRYRRKFFAIQNDHATQKLYLRNASIRMGVVYPQQPPLILETDAEIEVENDTATSVTYYVCEIFPIGP